jgi:hypothetical protein
VWAISTSAGKEAEAQKFGASRYLISTDAAAMAAQKGTFDFILCTAAANFNVGACRGIQLWAVVILRALKLTTDAILIRHVVSCAGAYLKLLKPRRSFCLVGLPAVSTPLQV